MIDSNSEGQDFFKPNAAKAIAKIVRGDNRQLALRDFTRAHTGMYRGRLWINRLARAAVLRPQLGSLFVHAAQINPAILGLLTAKIVSSNSRHSERSEA